MAIEELGSADFIVLVKRTREKHGVSIEEAHDLIFADEDVRRIVAARINRVQECRKMANRDMVRHGEMSRFVRDGDRIKFRRQDGMRPS